MNFSSFVHTVEEQHKNCSMLYSIEVDTERERRRPQRNANRELCVRWSSQNAHTHCRITAAAAAAPKKGKEILRGWKRFLRQSFYFFGALTIAREKIALLFIPLLFSSLLYYSPHSLAVVVRGEWRFVPSFCCMVCSSFSHFSPKCRSTSEKRCLNYTHYGHPNEIELGSLGLLPWCVHTPTGDNNLRYRAMIAVHAILSWNYTNALCVLCYLIAFACLIRAKTNAATAAARVSTHNESDCLLFLEIGLETAE
jgi:hypothetical protein